ncbi:MAG: hypothetical protein KGZ97_03610 [Bacteroidetes bacterium]|nr:hypothetical protein [Bacteroidota bacterium]
MRRGYTVLIVVLVLASISILFTASANFLGVDEIKNSITYRDSAINFYISTACVEYVLEKIKDEPDYATSSWVQVRIDRLKNYYCSYQVINKNLPKIINTKSDFEIFPRRLEVVIEEIIIPDKKNDGDNKIIISSWQEK